MKHYFFLYRTDRQSYSDPAFRYSTTLTWIEKTFPAQATDWEILTEARRHELKDLLEDPTATTEGILNRTLLRVLHIAHEIPLDLPEPT